MVFNTTLKKLTGAFAILLLASACAKSDNGRVGRVSGNGVGVAANNPTCGGNNAIGRVVDNGSATGGFQAAVDGLLSASVDPQYFGTIDGSSGSSSTGVLIQGRIAADNQGNLNIPATNLMLTIIDSDVGQTDSSGATIQPYTIVFNSASGGQVNPSTGSFTVSFKDSYGEIDLTGNVNSSTVQGTINYTNYANITGGSSASGSIGAFTIARCGFMY